MIFLFLLPVLEIPPGRGSRSSVSFLFMLMFLFGILVGSILTAVFLLVILSPRRTERRVRRLVERAHAAERLAELGMLTGGLAHEIKNPLSSLGLNIQLVQEDLADLEKDAGPLADRLARIRRRIDALSRETARLRDILEDFLRFAGRMKLDLAPVDAHRLVEELIDFLAPQAQASGVRILHHFSADPPTLIADAGLLKQALLNLMLNAIQAMADARQNNLPHGGASELIVRTERLRAPDGTYEILFHIIDTGPGIAPDLLKKVFQPYFTTKRTGTGLGLPTARRIVEEHGGTIHVHSELGRGTDFTVHLPVDGPRPLSEASPSS